MECVVSCKFALEMFDVCMYYLRKIGHNRKV